MTEKMFLTKLANSFITSTATYRGCPPLPEQGRKLLEVSPSSVSSEGSYPLTQQTVPHTAGSLKPLS